MKASNVVSSAVFACAAVFALLCPTACAAGSSGAHVFARYDSGTNIVSRLVPDGTDVATMGTVDERIALQPATYSDRPVFTEWVYADVPTNAVVVSQPEYRDTEGYHCWVCDVAALDRDGEEFEASAFTNELATSLVMGCTFGEEDEMFYFTATRVRTDVTGYALGPQTNKVLASTLAVDRLWDRSTNSFLKAEWENSDSSRSRLVESDFGVDFYMYDGDKDKWSRESRWDWGGFEIWGDDYVGLTGGDAPGLWVGSDPYGGNNILGVRSIGYLNGRVALMGPGGDTYDSIYFPTGVGEDNNVFALTKDIDGATNTLSASLSAQIDTESPLLARSYTVTPQDATWAYERAGGSPIYFRPRYFGMRDGDLFKGVVIRTKDSNLTPFPTVYMRVKRFSDGAVLGVSDAVSYPNTPNTDVVFRLPRAVALASKDNYYTLDFATTPDGDAIAAFGMRIFYLNGGSGSNPDCYLQSQAFVPVMTAQFYSWASVVAPSAAAEEGQLADAKATGEALDAKADKSAIDPLLFAQFYPDGSVKSAAEFTAGIKYDDPDTVNRTITVKPFCNTGDSENDNSGLEGRVVIPPFVDAGGNGYIADDGTKFKVVGVSSGDLFDDNQNLTAIIVPTTVATIGDYAFSSCTSLTSVSLPAAESIGDYAFYSCTSLTSVSLPAAESIGDYAFYDCEALASIDFGDTPRLSVPALGMDVLYDVPMPCKIIVPYTQYDAWIAAPGWRTLYAAGYKFLKHSEWEYARKCEVADLFLKFAPGWASGTTYKQYNLVQRDGTLYYKKSAGESSQTGAPGTDTTNWQSFTSLSDLTQLFLPLAGGTIDGSLTIGTGRKGRLDVWGMALDQDPLFRVGNSESYRWMGFSRETLIFNDSTQRYSYSPPSTSGTLALTAGTGHANNLAALDENGNPTDSGVAKTNVVTFTYDVNSNRTAVTVGVPRHNDPGFEADTPELDAIGEFLTVPALVGPHSLAITGDDESDPYNRTVASGTGSIAANKSAATNRFSVALGYNTFAAGEAAVSHGYQTAALGRYSHSEGLDSHARGMYSHAEGDGVAVSGYAAHAEGYRAEAHGNYSHAEGFYAQTAAEAWYAHSDGINTRATNHTAYVWQGASSAGYDELHPFPTTRAYYYSHGVGTYNVNPNGGLAGFWVGETNLEQHIDARLSTALTGKTMPANPSDAELRAAVSNIWEALGGSFQ